MARRARVVAPVTRGVAQFTSDELAHADRLTLQISRMIADFGQRLPTYRGWVRELGIWQVQETGHRLLQTFNVSLLADVAAEGLPLWGSSVSPFRFTMSALRGFNSRGSSLLATVATS